MLKGSTATVSITTFRITTFSIMTLTVTHSKMPLGNCDIDFFNFCHCQVQNFDISNLFKQNRNFAVYFWKHRKRNWKSTKYIATEQKQCIIPIKFCEILLVLWNFVNFHKISQFLIKFCKSLKHFRKILIKWLGKRVKYWLNFATKNGQKLGKLYPEL